MASKKIAVVALVFLGGFILFFAGTNQYKIPVLMYHHILTDEENTNYVNDSCMTPQAFDEHMEYLYKNGYETITADELYDYMYKKKEITGKKVLITFDDGYLSNYYYAYHILKKYKFTAIIFPIVSLMPEQPEPFQPEKLLYLSLPAIKESADVFEYGSHTYDMHRKDENDVPYLISKKPEEVKADLEKSFSVPGVKKYFAYPYGMFNNEDLKILKSLNVKLAFNVSDGYTTKYSDPLKIPRFSVKRSWTMEDFKKVIDKAGH